MTSDRLPRLPQRERHAHKGDFGRAYVVGGSRGMAGAVGLAAMAAHRAGAGLVTAVVPDRILETVASYSPNYTTVPAADSEQGQFRLSGANSVLERCANASSVGLGPGMGRGTEVSKFVAKMYCKLPCPVIVDADALNALAEDPQVIKRTDAQPVRVLTPHVGEFGRLVGESLSEAACREAVGRFAKLNRVIMVLKGPGTIVTDGVRAYQNSTGNPGMATGGSGDVLTGVVSALLGQMPAFEATVAAVYLHGLAGDIAAARLGQDSLVASDLIDALPDALKQFRSRDEG